jgi:DNA invertase Pin-like site-specific DNA recombinase
MEIVQMLIGYARVSTIEQILSLQKDALLKAGCEKIFEDTISGATASRPGLTEALAFARSNDVICVWRLDRIGRSLKNLIELVNLLEEKGIGLQSLQESINTTTSSGKLIFHVFGALAEFERNLIQERTSAGLAAARARGRQGGRPKALEPGKRKLAVDLYNKKEYPINEICKMMGISKPTLYEYVKEVNQPNP